VPALVREGQAVRLIPSARRENLVLDLAWGLPLLTGAGFAMATAAERLPALARAGLLCFGAAGLALAAGPAGSPLVAGVFVLAAVGGALAVRHAARIARGVGRHASEPAAATVLELALSPARRRP
jgi:hypothetical protein